MAGQNLEGKIGAAFALGLVTGLVLKEVGKEVSERIRGSLWHREYERTATYDENLPDPLGRREPAPEPGQPRYGGTGALGVSPDVAGAARTDE
jgi:hypothetical protein